MKKIFISFIFLTVIVAGLFALKARKDHKLELDKVHTENGFQFVITEPLAIKCYYFSKQNDLSFLIRYTCLGETFERVFTIEDIESADLKFIKNQRYKIQIMIVHDIATNQVMDYLMFIKSVKKADFEIIN